MSSSTEKASRHNSIDDIEAKPKLSADDVSYSEHDGEKVIINKAPDGGWKAWLVVVGSFCVSVNDISSIGISFANIKSSLYTGFLCNVGLPAY